MAKNPQISSSSVSREIALDGYLCKKGYTKAVTASATIAATIAEALPATVVACTIVNYDDTDPLFIQFDGSAADANAFSIPAGAGMTISGDSDAMALVRLYAASSRSVGIIPYVLALS